MPRRTTSQWAFGELFANQDLRQVLTVSELTGNVRRLLEERIGKVWVRGEVTNLRVQTSGHAYFTLKDAAAQLNCVLFRGTAGAGRELLAQGAQLLAQGELTVYEPRGQYQLIVRELELQGAGALQAAFDKLKRRLEAQGFFAPERKRRLRAIPERIGLVTSPSGAALRDVLHVISRRQPGLEIVLRACRVQGEGAAAEIARAIEELNAWSARQPPGRGLDLILLTRGGGSLEDLWTFNELPVAEAIFQSALPVVSAVGHETDFTISDFVADLRAATPSAAAEILTEGSQNARRTLESSRRTLGRVARSRCEHATQTLGHLRQRLQRCRPTRWLQAQMQLLDDLLEGLKRNAAAGVADRARVFSTVIRRLRRVPLSGRLLERRQHLSNQRSALTRAGRLYMRELQARWKTAMQRLRLLSPEQTLARGYSITTDANGRIIRHFAQSPVGTELHTRVSDGLIISQVLDCDRVASKPEKAKPSRSHQ